MRFPREIHRWALNFTLILILCVVGFYTHQQNSKAENALCVLRGDYERRLATSEEYVKDVRARKREPVPGITQADLQRSIDGLRSNINALSGLDC